MIGWTLLYVLAFIGALTVSRWLEKQRRAYGGVNRSFQYYMRPQ
jgi:hypothetical protein